jgi:hypothetical protein
LYLEQSEKSQTRSSAGRKPKHESRATEIRQRLLAWRQVCGPLRTSLRALATELGTSHQLLKHYLDGLEEWQCQERLRRAEEEMKAIRARAKAENRFMTSWEEQRVRVLNREIITAIVQPALLSNLKEIAHAAESGPVHPGQLKIAQLLAKQGLPGAREVVQKCLQVGLKKKKRFADIVKETPRQDGETASAWIRRIWDECDKYDTQCPTVLSEEILERYSKRDRRSKNNLPAQ